MSAACDEHHRAAIGDDVVARRDVNVADDDRHVRAGLDDAPARGARGGAPREDGEVVAARLVDVARRAVDDHTGDSAQLRAERQVASPARRVDAGALLDHDDVARLRRLDGRGPQMPRRRRPAIVFFELHGDDPAGDPAVGRQPLNAGDDTSEAQLVERVRHRAGIETARDARQIVHTSVVASGSAGPYCQYAKHIALPVPASER